MKVLTTSPVVFATNDVLDPGDVSETYNRARDSLLDVEQKRWEHHTIVLPFVESLSSTYTQASSLEERTYRFMCPTTCIVERAFLNANLVSSADVQVTIASVAAVTPAGATTPWLATGGAVAANTVDVTDLNVDRVLLVAGTTYLIVVSSGGTFTLSRFDVILHVATDRWTQAGSSVLPAYNPTLPTDANAIDATVIASNNSTLATAAALFSANKLAPAPELMVAHNVTNAAAVTFRIPRLDSTRAQCIVVRLMLFVHMDSAATAATVTALLKDNSGATVQTLTAAMAGVSQKTVDSGVIAQSLAAVASSANSSDDFTLVVSTNTADNVRKVYALMWVSR